jgi:DNA-binding transcriptional MerR regulator
MLIKELSALTGVPAKTIRYYESAGLLPQAVRATNNYRQYTPADVERLRFVASARSLGFDLDAIGEILAAREQGIAPCERVLTALNEQLVDLDRRLADLLALREVLHTLRTEGATLPLDDVQGEQCVCFLIKAYGETGQVVIQRQDGKRD